MLLGMAKRMGSIGGAVLAVLAGIAWAAFAQAPALQDIVPEDRSPREATI